MAKTNVKVSVTEKGPGFSVLAAELLGAELRVGVQGDEARAAHPNSEWSVGELAARHEMGLGVPERSFLRVWFDENEDRVTQQLREAFAQIAARKTTRKKALAALGYQWTQEIREFVASGKVTPALAASTVRRKKSTIPLVETATMVNAITYKLFLAQLKSIKDPAIREMLRRG